MDMNTIEQTEEFEEWLDGLSDGKARKAIAREIVKMQGGLFGDVEHIDGKVWEARIHYGPGYRVYYMRTGSPFTCCCAEEPRNANRRISRRQRN